MGIFVGLACRARCDVKSRNIWLPACFVIRKLIHSVYIIYYHNVQRWVFWSRETEIMKSHPPDSYARILVNIIEVELRKPARSLECFFFSTGFLKWNRCYCIHSNAEQHVYNVTSSLRVVPRGNINDRDKLLHLQTRKTLLCGFLF